MSLVGTLTSQDKHPEHEETVCGERLCAMQTSINQYPAHTMVSMVRMMAWTSERQAGGHSACTGRTLRSAQAGTNLQVLLSSRVGIRENRERRETLFCVAVFVLLGYELPLIEFAPEASSSVAHECMMPKAKA